MSSFLTDIGWFAALVATVYALNVLAYFGLNFVILALNARNPKRRIQAKRRGDRRGREEIGHSLRSIAVTATSLSIGLFAIHKGWTLFDPWAVTWWSALPIFVLCMVLFDAWFYFGHRLLHTRAFYRFHLLHHRSVAPTVWSSDSIGTVDTAICQGFYAIVPLIVPFPPLILVLHRVFDHVNGTFGHAGFEYFASRTARHPSPMLCTTYHDLHHSEFRYNFANYFSFWDRVLGTVHPGYDAMVADLERTAPPVRLSTSAGIRPAAGDETGAA